MTQHLTVPQEDYDTMLKAIENPPKPTQALRDAFRKRKEAISA